MRSSVSPDTKMPPDPCPTFRVRFKSHRTQSGSQTLCASGIQWHQFWQSFDECVAWTSRIGAAKVVNAQLQPYAVLCTR